jgi:hypothetical protein
MKKNPADSGMRHWFMPVRMPETKRSISPKKIPSIRAGIIVLLAFIKKIFLTGYCY